MQPTETKQTYYLLRFWKEGAEPRYAYDRNYRGAARRSWGWSCGEATAHKFNTRAEAKAALKSPAFEDMVEGVRRSYYDQGYRYNKSGRDPSTAWTWEIVKVVATTVVTYEKEICASNAPAMVQLARSLED